MTKKFKKKLEDELLEYILDVGEEGKTARQKYIKNIKSYNERYNAQRSILGLTYGGGVIKEPWIGASDFGFPLEAITIDNLVTREYKAKWKDRPMVRLKPIQKQGNEYVKDVEGYLEYKLRHKIPNFISLRRSADRVKSIEGGFVTKLFNTEYKHWETISDGNYALLNKSTGEYVTKPDGSLLTSDGTESLPNENFVFEEIKTKEEKLYFKGTKYKIKYYEDIIVPENADTPFVEDLDWLIDITEYSESDLYKMKKGMTTKEKKKIDELLSSYDDTAKKQSKRDKITLWEFWGSYDIDGDDIDEEIRVILSPDFEVIVSVEENPYGGNKPYFHHYLKERKKCFWGVGVVEYLSGIRGVIDTLINANFNRRSIADNPIILVNATAGYDPDLCEISPFSIWPVQDRSGIGELQLSKGEQANMADLQLLLGLAQKVYGGVSDYASGMESQIASNRTAHGIQSIINQGDLKFEDIVDHDQDINSREYYFMMKYLFPEDLEEIEGEDFVILGTDDPFRRMTKDKLAPEYLVECVTSDVSEKREVKYQKYLGLLDFVYRSQDPLILKDFDLRAKLWDGLLEAAFVGMKTKGMELLQQDDLMRKVQALQIQVENIAKIKDEKERDNKMQATEAITKETMAEAAQMVQRK